MGKKRNEKEQEVVQDAATGAEGNVTAEALGTGRVQQNEVNVADATETQVGSTLEGQEGVGNVKVVLNPARRAATVSFPAYDKNGNLDAVETFEEGKVHMVTQELAEAKDQKGNKFFVDAPESN